MKKRTKILIILGIICIIFIPKFKKCKQTKIHNKSFAEQMNNTLCDSKHSNFYGTKPKFKKKISNNIKNKKKTNIKFIRTKMWTITNLNLREQSNTNGLILDILPQGTTVETIYKKPNGWFFIKVGNNKGYVSGKYLSNQKIKPTNSIKSIKHIKQNNQRGNTSNKNNKFSARNVNNNNISNNIKSPNTIYFLGKSVHYKNGGKEHCQNIIDKNKNIASTFGGTPTYSSNNNTNTHFAAHRNGAFNGLWNVHVGSNITVTDSHGKPIEYVVTKKELVNRKGVTKDGRNIMNQITGTGGGKRVTLQTCCPNQSGMNYIIFAKKK